jgi:hypothetical protein
VPSWGAYAAAGLGAIIAVGLGAVFKKKPAL